jgi:hypothetical protein
METAEHAMTIAGLKETERGARTAYHMKKKTWQKCNAALWAAVLTAMRDTGATIQVAHDAEEGVVDANLYIGDDVEIGVNPGELSEYETWLEYADDGNGFGTYVWKPASARLLEDLIAEVEE